MSDLVCSAIGWMDVWMDGPIVLSMYSTVTQIQSSFISEHCKFWVKITVMYCLQTSYNNAFLSRNCLIAFLEPV
jgi:hypothetical protein